ncbi:unnamed protein product, partial [Lymnaea stagnalis]
LLSDETRHVIEVINYVFLSSSLALFGIVGNIVTIAVLVRQGLDKTANITFMGLAVSDLCGLIALQWYILCFNPLFVNSGVPMVPSEVQHLTGGFVKACFTRITCWITVFITAERCLCVVTPFKAGRLITTRRVTFIVCSIYIIMMASLLPEYCTMYIGWKFYADKNQTLLGLVVRKENDQVSGLTFLLYAVYILVSFLFEIVLTALLVIELKRKTKWRTGSTSDKEQSDAMSSRDQKAVRMVVVIAIVLIVCFTPSVVLSAAGFLVPGFGVVGKYTNLFFATWSFGFLFDSFNSSVTVILYYTMSSKYRDTFHELL